MSLFNKCPKCGKYSFAGSRDCCKHPKPPEIEEIEKLWAYTDPPTLDDQRGNRLPWHDAEPDFLTERGGVR